MSTEYINKGPIYLTQAKFEAMRQAGTLVAGQEYCITDYNPAVSWGNITGAIANQTDLNTILNDKESVSNKVDSTQEISESSTDTQYPSAKAVYNAIQSSLYVEGSDVV